MEADVVTMFAAALIPGLIAVALFILTILIYVTIVPGGGPAFLAVLPFFGAEIVRVRVLVAFPVFTLWLPGILE